MKKPLVLLGLVLVGMVFSSSGCRKKKDTIAKIYVRDYSSSLVSGATVRLRGQGDDPMKTETIDVSATTNASGEAIFNFNDVYQLGQAGVAVLNIYATKGDLSGEGIIKVEEETTSEKTVII